MSYAKTSTPSVCTCVSSTTQPWPWYVRPAAPCESFWLACLGGKAVRLIRSGRLGLIEPKSRSCRQSKMENRGRLGEWAFEPCKKSCKAMPLPPSGGEPSKVTRKRWDLIRNLGIHPVDISSQILPTDLATSGHAPVFHSHQLRQTLEAPHAMLLPSSGSCSGQIDGG